MKTPKIVSMMFAGDILPTEDLAGLWLTKNGMVDSIGLSVSDYLSIRSELRPIFFIDADTKRTDEDIAILAFSSEYINNGWELTGDVAKGLALYVEGISESILRKAYRYFGITWPDNLTAYWQRVDGTNILRTDGSPIEVF